MRLAEFGNHKVTEAGKAVLRYSKEDKLPRRDQTTIVLPDHALNEIIGLKPDWSQFLFRNSNYQGFGGVWFGGTDENPFLVRMEENVFNMALEHGARHFYTSIIPKSLRELAPKLPNHQCKLRRQGDIFCLSISYSPYTIIGAGKLIFGDSNYVKEWYVLKRANNHQVFGTRHELIGEGFQNVKLLGVDLPMIARGVIEAPDHSPLQLPRLSVLAQTELLYSPKEAD